MMGFFEAELVSLWRARVRHLRPYYCSWKPKQTAKAVTSCDVWYLPVVMMSWFTALSLFILFSLYLDGTLNLFTMCNNLDMMLNLQGSAIVLLLALAVTESEEQASSHHYISKNCYDNCSMCAHPHLRNGSVVTRVSSRGVPVTMVVPPLKSKCCGKRSVQYIIHNDDEHSTVISGLILLAGDVETNPGPYTSYDVVTLIMSAIFGLFLFAPIIYFWRREQKGKQTAEELRREQIKRQWIMKDAENNMKTIIERTVDENQDVEGLACIICNDYLDCPKLGTLMGADKDSDDSNEALKHVKFATIVRRNAKKIEIEALINEFIRYPYPPEYKCFVIVFTGHGNSGVIYSNDGEPVEMEHLIIQLIDIHKLTVLLFIDTCRLGDGKAISKPPSLLIAYATRDGYGASGDKGRGGYWIRRLAEYICKLKTATHIRDIITSVNKEILEEYGQSPEYRDTAIDVCFSPRSEFPMLQCEDLTKNEREELLTKLSGEYKAIKLEFARLVDLTFQLLKTKGIDPDDLRILIKMSVPLKHKILDHLAKKETIGDFFEHDYWNFFDYELLDQIIKNHCTELEGNLEEYVANFNAYCCRRVSEVPTGFAAINGGHYNIRVKLDDEFDNLKMKEVKDLEIRLRRITKTDLSILGFEPGSIVVVFVSMIEEDNMLTLSEKEMNELFQLNVLTLFSDNLVYFDHNGWMWKGLNPNKAKEVFDSCPDILEATSPFEEKDFRMLVKALHEVDSKWENIGMCLSIPAQIMKDLVAKWEKNAVRGMISILDEWMKGNYGTEALHPCWHSLVYVVADRMGGGNPAAASNIARNWKEYERDPFFHYPKAKKGDSSPLDVQLKTQIAAYLYRDYLHKANTRWFEIGVQLGVPIRELKELENKSYVNHIILMIEKWIDLSVESEYLPAPTLQILIDAVANKMGGDNPALALKLIGANTYTEPQDTYQSGNTVTQRPVFVESRAMQKYHAILIRTIKLTISSIAIDLYEEGLITNDVMDAMSLNYSTQAKAGKLVDCVRTEVKIRPARVHDFIAVLRRHDGEEAAKALELELGGTIQSRIQPVQRPSPGFTQPAVLNEEITHSKLNLMQWEKNHEVKNARLKEEMSIKWKEIGQNLDISDAVLCGYQGHHLDGMNMVITKWKDKAHKKYPATWAGLIKLLRSVELNNLGDMIKEAADDKDSTLYE